MESKNSSFLFPNSLLNNGGDIMIGIDDANFIRGKVPMTKEEIRILTLAKAKIGEKDFVVDVGAGTGSLSIEAAKLAKQGYVFAIEKNPSAVDLISQNAEKFDVDNIVIINAEAPEGLRNVSRIDVAIIGGSGGKIEEILDKIDLKLKIGGRIVCNFITVQSMSACLAWLKNHSDYSYEAIQVQITKLEFVGGYDMYKAQNPVHIVTAEKFLRSRTKNVIKVAFCGQR